MQYFLWIKSLPINAKSEFDASDEISSPDGLSTLNDSLLDEIFNITIDTFKKSEFIKNIEYKNQNDFGGIPFGYKCKKRILVFEDPIRLDMEVPLEKYELDSSWCAYMFNEKKIFSLYKKNFSILYDGFCYAYYRKVDFKGDVLIHEAIDQSKYFDDILGKNAIVDFDSSPIPFFKKFIIDTKPSNIKERIKLEPYNGELIIISTKNGITNINKFIKLFFSQINYSLHKYFSLTDKNQDLIFANDDIETIANSILENRTKFILRSNKNKISKKKYILTLSKEIQEFYLTNNLIEHLKLEISEDLDFLKKYLDSFFKPFSKEFIDHFSIENKPIESYLKIIELAQSDILNYNNRFNLWVTIVSSLIAAIIGSIIGVLFGKK